jgi:hypothetical protein
VEIAPEPQVSATEARDLGQSLELLWALDFAQASGFATQSAEIVELCAANVCGAEYVDFIDDLGVERENTLDALAEAHLADGEGWLRATAFGDDGAFEGLGALFVAFLDADVNADGVAWSEAGNVGALGLGQQLGDDG